MHIDVDGAPSVAIVMRMDKAVLRELNYGRTDDWFYTVGVD